MRCRTRLWLVVAVVLFCAVPAAAQTPDQVAAAHAASYRPTPGDLYRLTINYGFQSTGGSGPQSEQFDLLLRADATLTVPYAGEVDASELTLAELERLVSERLLDRLQVPFVSLVLALPASFDVLVWGSVGAPGQIRVTSVARLSAAVQAAGGVLPRGSARRVEVHRGDRVLTYDLQGVVRSGDGADPFLRPGDKVFVPVAEAFVEVRGAVAVPGRYEIAPGERIADVIALAGGLLPGARLDSARLTRLRADGRHSRAEVSVGALADVEARAGDVLSVPSDFEVSRTVVVEGAIHRSAVEGDASREVPTTPIVVEVAYAEGMTVLGVLERFGGPTGYADADRSFIIRAVDGSRDPVPDLQQLWSERRWDRDVELEPGDRLVIPMRRVEVAVQGAVRAPGVFPFTSGFSVADYLALAGGVERARGSARNISLSRGEEGPVPVDPGDPVPAGATISVGRSGWGATSETIGEVLTVAGWITGIVGTITAVINLIQIFEPEFP